MPRVKHTHVVRATCALVVICLYFVYTNPWSSGSKPGVWRGGGAADVLNYVNMFIGTKNGGKLFNLGYIQYAYSFQVMLSLVLLCLMVRYSIAKTKTLLMNQGMAKASADCVGEAHGGFASDGSDISGFSHMVLSVSQSFGNKLTILLKHSMTPGLVE